MPTKPKGASPTGRKRYCGLGSHHLRPPYKTITEAKMLSFAKHLNTEIRSTTLVCGSCYDTLASIYRVKMSHAIELQRGKRRAAAAANTNSISDVSNSQQLATASATLHSSSSAVSAYSTTDSSNLASTSTAKRKRDESQPANVQQSASQSSSSYDDDEPLLSLNAVNGTRLPNIQPIPKRRQFVHLNKDVMDIYLSGTTGG